MLLHHRAAVGERYVLEEMLAGGDNRGGEQSCHIFFSDHTTTGDGLLTALQPIRDLYAGLGEGLTLEDIERLKQTVTTVRAELIK